MNQYGTIAREAWTLHAPRRMAELEDPEFFEDLGEQIAAQVARIQDQLARSLPADLDYLERVGQMNAIRKQAEEVALQDLVYGPIASEPGGWSLLEELDTMLGELPSARMIQDSIQDVRDRAWVEAQREEREVRLSQEQAEEIDLLMVLLPLVDVDPEELTDEERAERIEALRPFHQALS